MQKDGSRLPADAGGHAGKKPPTGVPVAVAGFGCCLTLYCGGILTSLYGASLVADWSIVLIAQFTYLCATGIVCALFRACAFRATLSPVAASVLCLAGMLASVLLAPVLVSSSAGPWALVALEFLMGAASSYPLLFWFEGLLRIFKAQGRRTCIFAIVCAQLLGVVLCFAVLPLRVIPKENVGLLAALSCAALAVSCCCQCYAARRFGWFLIATPGEARPKNRYRLTRYSAVVLVSFGVTWGIARSAQFCLEQTGELGMWQHTATVLAGLAACVAVAAVGLGSGGEGIRFGMIIRLSVAVAGALLASMGVCYQVAPWFAAPLCQIVVVVQGMAMTLLSVEIAHENGQRIVDVMPANYALYTASACLAGMMTWGLYVGVSEPLAWSIVWLVAVLATVAVIPLLPGSRSDAAVFALSSLPENEGYAERASQLRARLASKYGLSAREGDVAGLLIEGKTRQQIADELSISSWTAKDYIGAVYKKTGVHSAKELMKMVAGGAE